MWTPGGDIGFLDHDDVYDGFGDPPALLTAAAVAAAACGFGVRFSGDVRDYLAQHFAGVREFYREAAGRGHCVAVWID
jgi:hypothetical protein